MTFGSDIVCPNMKCDLGVRLGMARVKDGHEKAGCDLITKILEERVGFKHVEMTCTTTSDRAAKCIATMLNHDEDVCDMHDWNKIVKSAIRGLVRIRNKAQHFLIFAAFRFYFTMTQFLNLSFFYRLPAC